MTQESTTNDFERWVAALQQALLEQEQALFSATVLAEARQPQNIGTLDAPDGLGFLLGPCGDTMAISLQLNGQRIAKAAFRTDGCGPTVACGSMLTRMVQGNGLEEAAAIEAADLIIALDGLPPEHVHCATLAIDTLRRAIANCQKESVDQ
jgi:nitrogen fixation NifU-like protein